MSPSRNLLLWGVIGSIAILVGIIVAFDRLAPVIGEREVPRESFHYETVKVIKDVKTLDGKIVKAEVEVELPVHAQVLEKVEVLKERTPEQKLRIQILIGACGVLLLFMIGLIIVYFNAHFRGRKPPKTIEETIKYYTSGLIGAVVGFLGSPTGDWKETVASGDKDLPMLKTPDPMVMPKPK